MKPESFVYWLQGFAELTDGIDRPSAAQWAMIKDHLALVFKKETKPLQQAPREAPITLPTTPWPDTQRPMFPDFRLRYPEITCSTSSEALYKAIDALGRDDLMKTATC